MSERFPFESGSRPCERSTNSVQHSLRNRGHCPDTYRSRGVGGGCQLERRIFWVRVKTLGVLDLTPNISLSTGGPFTACRPRRNDRESGIGDTEFSGYATRFPAANAGRRSSSTFTLAEICGQAARPDGTRRPFETALLLLQAMTSNRR